MARGRTRLRKTGTSRLDQTQNQNAIELDRMEFSVAEINRRAPLLLEEFKL